MGGHTWMTDGHVTPKKIAALLATKPEGKWPPILSDVRVHEKPRALTEIPPPIASENGKSSLQRVAQPLTAATARRR